MAILTGWSYRKKITLTGQTGAGANYQVLLKVGESSGATGEDFDVANHAISFPSAKNDSGDLRFTSSDGSTLLDFWVQEVTGSTPNRLASVWVEVSADLGSNQDIYCYYGKTGASNVSNGDNTFILFDDFEGSSLDTAKWDLSNPGTGAGTRSITVASSIITISSIAGEYVNKPIAVSSKSSFSLTKKEIIGVHKTNWGGFGSGSYWRSYGLGASSTYGFSWGGGEGGLSLTHSNSGGSTNSGRLDSTDPWTSFALRKYSFDTSVKFLKDGSSVYSSASNIPNTSELLYFTVNNWSPTTTSIMDVDWLAVKNFINTEPSYNSASAEEVPVDATNTSNFFQIF